MRTFFLSFIALAWIYVGVSKIAGKIDRPNPEQAAVWADQFPRSVLIAVSLAEICAGAAIIAGYRRTGLIACLGLISAFCGALYMYPLASGQSCGCMGQVAAVVGIDELDPAARNMAFAALHVLALTLVWPIGAPRRDSEASQTPVIQSGL